MSVERITVTSSGIAQSVLVQGPPDGPPVLLVHGNCSSGAVWLPLLRHLPGTLRIAAPDLRGYGDSDAAPVDSTRGLRDFADDVAALLTTPEVFPAGARPVVAGHSMGAGVAMQLAVDHPQRVSSLLLESPVSPYGFGATRGADGTPTTPDFAGSGGGCVNPDFVKRIAANDRSVEETTSPRNVLRSAYVADPAALGDDEEALLDTILSTVVGVDNYPGDAEPSENWPMTAPGTRGLPNAISPRWFRLAEAFVGLDPKPPVTWIRGDSDVIVSDTSLFDLAYLGSLGLVPGWPGEEACPPQPMIAQTRAVLDRYAAAGGLYQEIVYVGCGHSPHIEHPTEFAASLVALTAGR